MKKFWMVIEYPIGESQLIGHYYSTYIKARESAESLAKTEKRTFVVLEAMECCKLNDVIWGNCEENE